MDNTTSTVQVRCPQCGAQQEVDSAQDAAICRYCGKPFSAQKGISAYNERYFGTQQSGMDNRTYASPGPTYYAEPQKPKKRHTFWWVMGWIFCFPIPLTILMLRNRKLPAAVRYGIIALGWIVYLYLGIRGRTSQTERTPAVSSIPAVTETTSTPNATIRPTETPQPTATPEPVEEGLAEEEETEDESSFSDGVTPEFKEAMDSYEAFFDVYCEFMKTMSDDPTNFDFLLEYADMMTQYADTMEKLDAIDEAELSPADNAYYIEVMARIDVKLLEAANYMN